MNITNKTVLINTGALLRDIEAIEKAFEHTNEPAEVVDERRATLPYPRNGRVTDQPVRAKSLRPRPTSASRRKAGRLRPRLLRL
jgi:hypothetical protein